MALGGYHKKFDYITSQQTIKIDKKVTNYFKFSIPRVIILCVCLSTFRSAFIFVHDFVIRTDTFQFV
jgi:hypothetical protein